MRIRLIGSAMLAAAFVPFAVDVSEPAAAASAARAHYVVITGDSHYVVYAEAVRSHRLDPVTLGAADDIYALGKTGKPIHLGKAAASPQLISLSRSHVVIVNPFKHHERVRSFDLGSGAHSAIGTNEDVVGATPDGWIAKDKGFTDGTHVVARADSGGITDYGTPLTPGVDFGVAVGPNGFVAYADNFQNSNGEVTYTPWAHPSVHRTLLAPGGKDVRCDSVSSSYAACVVGSGLKRFVELIALDGKTRALGGNRCANQLAVWGSQVAWNVVITQHMCERGQLGLMTTSGTTKKSKLRFDPLAVTTAWGRLVTSDRGQRDLVTLRKIRGKPITLKRARIS
ncbi:MAG TPA: hypothetical protein VHE56_12140 [Mycobacteriales bacterium]|nr:hypothetical protein [Mycobacteriales bacterium]